MKSGEIEISARESEDELEETVDLYRAALIDGLVGIPAGRRPDPAPGDALNSSVGEE